MSSKQFYKRGWHHNKGRGRETSVTCGFCGKIVPKYKTFAVYRGFSITDPSLRNELGGRGGSLFSTKLYACPGCARHRRIIKKKR